MLKNKLDKAEGWWWSRGGVGRTAPARGALRGRFRGGCGGGGINENLSEFLLLFADFSHVRLSRGANLNDSEMCTVDTWGCSPQKWRSAQADTSSVCFSCPRGCRKHKKVKEMKVCVERRLSPGTQADFSGTERETETHRPAFRGWRRRFRSHVPGRTSPNLTPFHKYPAAG